MILTPLVMRKNGQAQANGSKASSPSLQQPYHQLDVPKLDLNAVDDIRTFPISKRETRLSVTQSEISHTGSSFQEIPMTADALLKRESISEEKTEEKDEEKEEEAKEPPAWLTQIRIIFPHIALATIVILYTMIGGAVFYWMEHQHERDHKSEVAEKVRQARQDYLERMWNLTQNESVDRDQFFEQSVQELEAIADEIFQAFEEGISDQSINGDDASPDLTWTYAAAVLFSVTIITTVGYGNLVPKTFIGRLFCIIYALLGIPLTLITIADIGKFIGTMITWSYDRFRLMTDTISARMQRVINRFHPGRKKSEQSNFISLRKSSRRRSSAWPASKDYRRRSSEGQESRRKSTTSETKQNHSENKVLQNVDEEKQEEIKEEVKSDQDVTLSEDLDDEEDEDEELEEENDIPVPPSFILMIVVGYTALCAMVFTQWEGWEYLDSFYYCLITITTVGFGDLVPSDASYTAFVMVFIFFGLILATMCIDMVGSHYIQKMHFMGRKLQDAKAALALIGGKAVNMKSWARQLKRMQKQYGMTDEQIKRLMENPEDYMEIVEAAKLQLKQMKDALRAFEPKDAARFRYIDQIGGTNSSGCSPATPSQIAELMKLSLCSENTMQTPESFNV